MTLEILRDPKEEALGYCLFIDPSRHRVVRTPAWPWFEWLRRVTGNDRLMVYQHQETGRWVLGSWAWAPWESIQAVVVELEGFDCDPNCSWPFDMAPEVMRQRLQPVREESKKMARRAQEREAAKKNARVENHDQRMDTVRYLKKRGMDLQAHQMEIGAVPYSGSAANPEAHAEWTDFLTHAAKHI